MTVRELRQEYHKAICQRIIRLNTEGHYNFADVGNRSSIQIAKEIVRQLEYTFGITSIVGQNSGSSFEEITGVFIRSAFGLLSHIRPGEYVYDRGRISQFAQYSHLAQLVIAIKDNRELQSVLGTEYIITPDLVIGRVPLSDQEINSVNIVLEGDSNVASLTSLRKNNFVTPQNLLHAKHILQVDYSERPSAKLSYRSVKPNPESEG